MDIVSLNKESLAEWQNENLEELRYQYDLKPEDTVFDIGSYRREWGGEIVKRYGCKVEYFDALDNRAAWIHDGHISLGGAYYYSSAWLPNQQDFKCVDIVPEIDRYGEVRLMKVNIEGGEYSLLDHIINCGRMHKIQELQVQFHLIQGQDSEKDYAELANRLSETHELTWRYPFVWENWKRC